MEGKMEGKTEGKTERIVLAHREEIEEIKRRNPAISEAIELFKKDIRKIMNELNMDLKNIDKDYDRELVCVLIVNQIHKMTDEIFL